MNRVIVKAFVMMLLPFFCQSFEIQGHRGARGLLPENTLPAFAAAIEAGVDGIEMDLLMTKDEEIVIHHDFFVNARLCRHQDGSSIQSTPLIQTMTLAELKCLDCGSFQHPLFPQQQAIPGACIPTLRELFDLLSSSCDPKARAVKLNLEIKADPETPHYIPAGPKLVNKIVQIVHECGFADQVYYSSFDFSILAELRNIDVKANLGLIFETSSLIHQGIDPIDWACGIIETARQLKAKIVSPDYALLTDENVQALHGAGLHIIPWTVNDPQQCLHLLEMGADGVITDYPADMLAITAHLKEGRQQARFQTSTAALAVSNH